MLTRIHRKLTRFTSDKSFSEILTGSAWALSAKLVAAGLALISSIFIARVYGAEVVGIVALLRSLVALATIFTVIGTKTSILRLIPEYMKKYSATAAYNIYRKTQYIVVGASILTAALLYFGSSLIADALFSKPQLTNLIEIASLFIIVSSLMDLNTSAIRGLRLNRIFALMHLLPDLSKLIILLIATYLFFSPNIPVYSMFAAWLITAITGLVIMQYAFNNRISLNDVSHDMSLKDILSISLPMLLTSSMSFIIGKSGIIILGIFRSETEVGYYSIAVILATLNTFTLSAINTMAASKFSELYHTGNIDELFYVAKKSTRLIFWTSMPLLVSLVIFGIPILGYVYGDEFTAAYPALLLLAFGQFINAISGSTGMFMNMTGHQHKLRNIMMLAAGLNIVLNFLLTPTYGMIGPAIAGMVSIAYWNIHVMVFIKKKHGHNIGYLPLISKVK